MKTIHHVEFTGEYLKEAQRLAISQNATLRLLLLSRWSMWVPATLFGGFMTLLFLTHQLSFEFCTFAGATVIASFAGPLLSRGNLAKARRRSPL